MKIEIKYMYDFEAEPHYWATSVIDTGDKIFSGGDSWDACRARHMKKLKELDHNGNKLVPPPEEVEV